MQRDTEITEANTDIDYLHARLIALEIIIDGMADCVTKLLNHIKTLEELIGIKK